MKSQSDVQYTHTLLFLYSTTKYHIFSHFIAKFVNNNANDNTPFVVCVGYLFEVLTIVTVHGFFS